MSLTVSGNRCVDDDHVIGDRRWELTIPWSAAKTYLDDEERYECFIEGGGGGPPITDSFFPPFKPASTGKKAEPELDGEKVKPQEGVPFFGPEDPEDFPFLPYDMNWGSGPCGICGLGHSVRFCALQDRCPIGQTVGDGYVVVCLCGSYVVGGKCPEGCYYTVGRAGRKLPKFV